MKVSAGVLLILIGIGHTFVGIWFGQEPLSEITRSGWVNSVNPQQPERMAVFWFLFTGFVAMLLGASLRWIERQGPIPAGIGWTLLAFGIVGGLMMPVSGFWLLLPLGWVILHRARGRRAA